MNKFCSLLKTGYNKAKNYLFALLAVFGVVTVCNAQEGAQQTYDIQIVADIGNRLEATLESFWSSNSTTIYITVGLIVATALIWMVVRFFTKGTRRA